MKLLYNFDKLDLDLCRLMFYAPKIDLSSSVQLHVVFVPHFSFKLITMLAFQVKGLLKDRKLEALVDSDLDSNYIEEEVEQLIQIALLCTQGSPMDRPKMAEVVRMLEGDGLAERWEEWQKEEMVRQEFNHTHNLNLNWIIADSTSHIPPDELSGPR